MATTSAYYVTGATVKAVIRNAALQFADVVHEAMDTYNASDIDDYDIACTEIGNIGEYHVTWPTSWMAVGAYNIQYVPLAGGSIVESDMLNRFSASNYYWDGTNLVPDWAVKLAISASPITDSIEELTNAIEAIVAHADYGNAKLVRSTTPANTLTVDTNHEVTVPDTQKVDVETIKTQAITCGAAITVGVYVGSSAAASIHDAAAVYTAFGDGGNLTTCATAIGFATPTNITAGTITTVETTTTNTDMRGTDGANTTTPPTVGEIDTKLTAEHGENDWTSATGTGDASAANQALILEDIVDMKGTLFAKDTDSMVNLAHTGADADTLATLSTQIDSWGTGVTVSRTTTGTAPIVDVDVGQYEAFSLAITAQTAQTGDSHELTAYTASDPKTAVFRYTTANGDITVGGSGDLTITISADNTNMRTARQLQYVLWNTTDSEKISEGVIDIEAHPEPL